jgi:ribonuclease HII
MNQDPFITHLIAKHRQPAFMDSVGSGCERDDAEILTKNGWKNCYQITYDDEVMSFTDKKNLEWQSIEQIIIKKIKEPLLELKNKSIHIVVTKNHCFDVLVAISKRDKNYKENIINFKLVRKNVLEMHDADYIPRGGSWKGKNLKYFYLPGIKKYVKTKNEHLIKKVYSIKKILMKDWLSFLGIYLSEGSVWNSKIPGDYRVYISQRNTEKRIKIKELLNRLPYHFYEQPDNYIIHNFQLWNYLKNLGNKYQKYIPTKTKELSSELLNVLLDWLIMGDGCSKTSKNKNRVPIRVYFTSSVKLKDDVEEILLKTGRSFSTRSRFRKSGGLIRGRKVIQRVPNFEITFKTKIKSYVKFLKKGEIEYSGNVFCLGLKKYHNFFVRRSNSGYFTGNSIFGPLVACAVMLPIAFYRPEVDDSKKLKHDLIYTLAPILKKKMIFSIGIAEIEEIRQLQSTFRADKLAMLRAVKGLKETPDALFVDGDKKYAPRVCSTEYAIVKGDEKVFGIACASIIAKDYRDHLVEDRYSKKYARYCIHNNHGYYSPEHMMAIRRWGLTPQHRNWQKRIIAILSGKYDKIIQEKYSERWKELLLNAF